MFKKFKRGFTIVELVVVIAVIALLAAVMIPIFVNVSKDAKLNADSSLVKNLNTSLALDEATNGQAQTMQAALDAVKEYGYSVDKLTPTSNGDIVWDQTIGRFSLISEGEVVFGDSVTLGVNLWKLTDSQTEAESGEYSYYLKDGFAATSLTVSSGIDVGENQNIDITYSGTDAQTVLFRTNGGELSVDNEKAVVNHYGESANVTITAVAPDSYHEYGTVNGYLKINAGHVEVSAEAIVQTVYVQSVNEVKLTVNASTVVILGSASTKEITISGNAQIYLDDQTDAAITVEKPSNAVSAISLTSEADIKNNSVTNSEGDYALKSGYYKLGADITLARQLYIDEGDKVIFDLNGHAFISTFAAFGFANYGELTINDSSAEGSGRVYNTNKAYSDWAHDAVRNFGYLVINGGHFGDADDDFTNANDTTYGAALRNIGTAVINGGFFTCVDNYGYFNDVTSIWSTDVSDYTVKDGFVYYQNGTSKTSVYSYAIRSAGALTINQATVYGAMNGGIAADAGTILINNANIQITGAKSYYALATSSSGTITVNDGDFVVEKGKGVFGGYNGMPSWTVSGLVAVALSSNGFFVNGGTFTYIDTTYTYKDIV